MNPVIATFRPRYVDAIQSEEPSHVRARPHLVESSASQPRRQTGQQVKITLYRNPVLPMPEDIPLRVRFSRTGRNLPDAQANRQAASNVNRVSIVRSPPRAYSDQIMDNA